MSGTTKLRRSERLYRWKDGDTWRSGWVLVCDGSSPEAAIRGSKAIDGTLLVHCSLLQDVYWVRSSMLELVPRREEYEAAE